jgi:multidrug resistance efflux pump
MASTNHGWSAYLLRFLGAVAVFTGGCGLLVWSLQVAAQRANNLVVKEASIDGHVILTRAPINGQILGVKDISLGALVSTDQSILKVSGLPIDPKSLLESKLNLARDKASLVSIQSALTQVSAANGTSLSNERSTATSPGNSPTSGTSPTTIELAEIDLKMSLAKADINQLTQEIKHLEVQAQFEQAKYETLKNLYEGGGAPQLDFIPEETSQDTAFYQWQLRQQELEAAKVAINNRQSEIAQFGQLKRAIEQTTFANLKKEQNQLQASIQLAQQEIAKTEKQVYEVIPPQRGKVLDILVSEGEIVAVNQPLLAILDCQKLWVDIQVEADDLRYVGTNSVAEVTLYHNRQKLQGVVKSIRYLSKAELEQQETDSEQKAPQALPEGGNQMSDQAKVRIELESPTAPAKPASPVSQDQAQPKAALVVDSAQDSTFVDNSSYCNIGDLAQVKIVNQRSSHKLLPSVLQQLMTLLQKK